MVWFWHEINSLRIEKRQFYWNQAISPSVSLTKLEWQAYMHKIKDVKWREPVMITLPQGMKRKFHSVYDAYDFLLYEWSLPLGGLYLDALHYCKEVLSNEIDSEYARQAFIAVSRSQNCLLEG